MQPGKKVSFSWQADGELQEGTGVVISEAATQFEGEDAPHVLVSVDPKSPEARHFVIRCAVTWLTEVSS